MTDRIRRLLDRNRLPARPPPPPWLASSPLAPSSAFPARPTNCANATPRRVESIVETRNPPPYPSLPGSGTPKNWDGIRRTADRHALLATPQHRSLAPKPYSRPSPAISQNSRPSPASSFSTSTLPPAFLRVLPGAARFGVAGTRASSPVSIWPPHHRHDHQTIRSA